MFHCLCLSLLQQYIPRRTLISLRNIFELVHQKLRQSLTMSRTDPQTPEPQPSAPDPTPFDPSQPSTPISYPIKSLQDLDSKAYFNSFHFPFNKASVRLQSKSESLPNRPRILVCHDMEGGYVDDKWVQGGSNEGAYAIWHWYLMDVFVYFSHNLVTLPPPCWTNTAHRHGVKVLGTFITEWDEGRLICNTLLATKESAHTYAERLKELAVELGFDGWLINMEVVLNLGQIPNLKEFVSYLTQIMHSSVPGSLVIWYDSVTIDGDLKWQNQLNEKNKPFFDICDGIFVNYTWTEDYPRLSAAVAGDRKFDVYMGIDVFGRKTYGGGQWNTNVALDVLKKDNVSSAIFAPGWVYETKQPPDFQTAQNHWWSLVEKSWGILQNYPKVLPFYSNFDQGQGYHVCVEGGQVSNAPWNNISSQGFQPFLKFAGDPTRNTIQVLVNYKEESYSGGGNITFKGTLDDNAYFSTRLLQGELLLGDLPAHFTYSVKSEGNSLLGLSLEFSSATNGRTSLFLASWETSLPITNEFSSKVKNMILPDRVEKPESAPGWIIQERSIAMNGYTLTEIHAVCYKSKLELVELKSDGSAPNPSEYYAVLGHILVKTPEQNSTFPPSTSWLVEGQYVNWTSGSDGSKSLRVKITWKLKNGDDSLFPKYNIYVEKLVSRVVGSLDRILGVVQEEYLGVAQVQAFYVADLAVPSGISSLKFIIQVCCVDGACQKLDDSPFLQLEVEG